MLPTKIHLVGQEAPDAGLMPDLDWQFRRMRKGPGTRCRHAFLRQACGNPALRQIICHVQREDAAHDRCFLIVNHIRATLG